MLDGKEGTASALQTKGRLIPTLPLKIQTGTKVVKQLPVATWFPNTECFVVIFLTPNKQHKFVFLSAVERFSLSGKVRMGVDVRAS